MISLSHEIIERVSVETQIGFYKFYYTIPRLPVNKTITTLTIPIIRTIHEIAWGN